MNGICYSLIHEMLSHGVVHSVRNFDGRSRCCLEGLEFISNKPI